MKKCEKYKNLRSKRWGSAFYSEDGLKFNGQLDNFTSKAGVNSITTAVSYVILRETISHVL